MESSSVAVVGHPLEAWVLLFSAPLIALLIIIELVLSNCEKIRLYSVRETVTTLFLAMINGSFDFILRMVVVLPVLLWAYQYHFLNWSEKGMLYWFLLFIFEDCAFYILHCVDHYNRVFWAVHVTHHSSIDFNISTGFRSSVFQPLYRTIYFLPLTLLGFEPLDILLMYAITQIYGALIHTQKISKLGWLEWILVTPSHHRVHHASNGIYLDKNMGMCLIIWDRLFGTFQKELVEEPVKYGVTQNIEDRSLQNMVFHEWKNLWDDIKNSSLPKKEKWKHLWHGPGWKP
jgi:sterol desaturase/sphingolipid hydroxylase (fatty acid hydroxylase superfamily)